ncbi:MAG: hypothetical protein GF309_06725 [Candidatus Lokiarchaeota archaeon]|nr:hypothetical protein [Candidatus Lokiarchaeota archaeon]
MRHRIANAVLTEKQNDIEYNGFWKPANTKPDGEYVLVWVSDWLKQDWGFYCYISLDAYKQDLDGIHGLIEELNFRGVDVYVEMVDHSPGLKEFYGKEYNKSKISHYHILKPETWERVI